MKLAMAFVTVALAATACASRRPAPSEAEFSVVFKTTSEDGEPLATVALSAGGKPLGASDASGRLTARLQGSEGQSLDVKAICPEGYASPEAASPIRLSHVRALGKASLEPIAYQVVCERKLEQIAIAVRAEHGKELPVLVNGIPKGVTDRDGQAHLLVEVDRDVPSLRVELDTTLAPASLPQNPSRVFELHGEDAILIFEQKFTEAAPLRARPAAPAPPRHVPQRLD